MAFLDSIKSALSEMGIFGERERQGRTGGQSQQEELASSVGLGLGGGSPAESYSGPQGPDTLE